MREIERDPTEEPIAKKMKFDPTTKCVLRWAKLTDKALEPVRGSKRAAGFDLRSAYDVTVPARGKAIVKTDLQVAVPVGCYGRVAPRSGLAVKNFIDVGAGVVDEDYRGNLGVVLFNHANEDFEVKVGDRIAQFICERIFYPELEFCEKLDDTERGASGFGSTGVSKVIDKNGAENEAAKKTDEKKAETEKNGDAKKKADTEKFGGAEKTADTEEGGDVEMKADTEKNSGAETKTEAK